ncbi:unnamed protein product [Microthlaspi erraticum]|uniref:Zinc knuckle CX2CX4HX4C domain-containing protein n=1 Tax=Microthlaspi erraticum TaxID=1685480 RepID=A0A6D2HVD4_9BRAS|nr:unnamed protein product [Microthlaspi erraticum]
MARRFSYAEKGKAVVTPQETPTLKRIRAPDMDTSDLVEANALTLIGRSTNPREQRVRSLIPYFTNRWEIKGEIEGSDLGNNCFQFRFTLEPIISANFPSQIPFWIYIRGLPLHYWKQDLICKIGKEAGEVLKFEISKTVAKTKVSVNALKPIVKVTEVEFATGEVALVSLEYERLGLHCSICNSLTHKDKFCSSSQEQPRQNAANKDRPRSPANDKHHDKEPQSTLDSQRRRTQGEGERSPKEKRDRHGNLMQDKPVYTNRGKKSPVRGHPRGEGRNASVKLQRKFYREEERRYHGTSRRHSPPQLQWREKVRSRTPSRQEESGRSETSRPQTMRRALEDRNPPEIPIPTTEEVMQELQEVTIQYINCPDPAESAARRQRVMLSEEQGLMEETAANIITAATISYQRTLNFEQDQEEEEVTEIGQQTTQDIPCTQDILKKRRGRPPKNKRNSPAVGISLRQRRMAQVNNSPQVRDAGDRASGGNVRRIAGISQRQVPPIRQRDPGTSTSRTTPETNVPALSRATENFRSPRDPLP